MSQMISEAEITRPATTPLASTVLDHATVNTIERFGLRNNEGLWPSYNCLDTLVPTPLCPDPLLTETGGFKTFGLGEWVPAFQFAVQGGVQCQAIGLDEADMERELSRVFALNEGKGVEMALLATRFVEPDSGAAVQWDAPVEVAPGVVPITVALALLEGYAAVHYAGVPTIHMPRAVASLLNERIVWTDGKAYTRNGSKVAIGGGYDAQGGVAGEWDMYATGEVYVERSDTLSFATMVLPGDGSGTGSGENGLEQNTRIALVERMYRVAVDCFAAKVTGGVPLTVGGGGGGAGLIDNGDGTWSEA